MATNHWVTASYDQESWTLGTVFTRLDVDVPAGATMKRYQVVGNDYQATNNGVNLTALGNFSLRQSVEFTLGDYGNRQLAEWRRAIPKQVVGLYDPVSANRIYSAMLHGGDNEFLINERATYGKRDGGGFRISLFTSITGGFGFTGFLANNSGSAIFRVLYETVP